MCARLAITRVLRASRSSTECDARDSGHQPTCVYARAGACVRTERGVYACVCIGERRAGLAAVPQVKAILKVRFRFVSREFAACER